jgi:hypothetical protein
MKRMTFARLFIMAAFMAYAEDGVAIDRPLSLDAAYPLIGLPHEGRGRGVSYEEGRFPFSRKPGKLSLFQNLTFWRDRLRLSGSRGPRMRSMKTMGTGKDERTAPGFCMPGSYESPLPRMRRPLPPPETLRAYYHSATWRGADKGGIGIVPSVPRWANPPALEGPTPPH